MSGQNQHQITSPQKLDNRSIAKQILKKDVVDSSEDDDRSAQQSTPTPVKATPTRLFKKILPFVPSLNLSPRSDGRHTFSPAEGSLIHQLEEIAEQTASNQTTGLRPLRLLRLFTELEEKHQRTGSWVQGLKPYERRASEDEAYDGRLAEEWKTTHERKMSEDEAYAGCLAEEWETPHEKSLAFEYERVSPRRS